MTKQAIPALPSTGTTLWGDLVSSNYYQYIKVMGGSAGYETDVFVTRRNAVANVTGATTVDIDCSGQGTVLIEWTGTFTGLTGTFKVDFGNGVWDTAHTFQIYDLTNNNHFVSFNSISTARRIMVNCAGMAGLRMDVSALSTGQVDVDMASTPGVFPLFPANQQITALSSSARTVTTDSADLSNYYNNGGVFNFNVTSAGTGSQTLSILNKDRVSGVYYTLLSGAAVTTNSMNNYYVFPGATETANVSTSKPVGRTFRVTLTANNANSMTSSVGHDAMV
jgi:hypothetical protein